ncbi:MAG: hypothetical protein ABDH18_01795, partial [Aquificaceae bacterium]
PFGRVRLKVTISPGFIGPSRTSSTGFASGNETLKTSLEKGSCIWEKLSDKVSVFSPPCGAQERTKELIISQGFSLI